MPQPLSYHAFADCRAIWSIPNFFNVVSNLPFLVGGALGLALIWRGGGEFIDPREALPYLVFFLGALLTSFGSAYYHLAPDNPRLVWDRLPMTLGFAGLVSAAIAERVDPGSGLRALWPLLAVGAVTVIYWYATERAGRGQRHSLCRLPGLVGSRHRAADRGFSRAALQPRLAAGLGCRLVRAGQGLRNLSIWRSTGSSAAR